MAGTPVQRLASQLRRGLLGDAWHGPALFEILKDVSPEEARFVASDGVHSIWETALHIQTWIDIATGALAGSPIPPWPFPGDWPAPAGSWSDAVAGIQASADALVKAVAAMEESKLDETVPGRDHSFHFLLNGVLQHNAYHSGQIAIVKKIYRS